jgi:hypothetical protein
VIRNLSGRVATLMAGAVVVAVLLAGWFVLVSPERSKAADLSVKIDQTQAQVASTQAYVDSPVTRRAVHDLKRLQRVLPDNPSMSQILRQLSTAAGAARISLDGITPAAPIPSSGGEAVPIAVTVTGHYFNISRFLQLLRNDVRLKGTAIQGSGRLFSVDGIQFTGGSAAGAPSTLSTSGAGASTGGSGTIAASIALNAFVYSTAVISSTTATATGSSSP